jgi:hypothetical protein
VVKHVIYFGTEGVIIIWSWEDVHWGTTHEIVVNFD